MTISHGFYNYHLGMPRPMIKIAHFQGISYVFTTSGQLSEIISHGQVNKTRFAVSGSEIIP